MPIPKTALKETIYLTGKDAAAVRAFACETGVKPAQAMRSLIAAGLAAVADQRTTADELARFRAEYHVRDRELFGLLTEIVLGIRFLAETQKPGMEKQLRTWATKALAALLEKIERNEKAP